MEKAAKLADFIKIKGRTKKIKGKTKKLVLSSLGKKHEEFLLQRLKKEWQEAEIAVKKHELIQRVKTGAFEFGRDLLRITAIGGMVMVLMVAPKVFVAVNYLNRQRRFFKDIEPKETIQTHSSRGYVNYRQVDEITWRVEITEKGKKMLLRAEAEKMKIKATKKWDGIWRLVGFDISRKHNKMRDALRDRLRKIGMRQLQESLFVCPYPCEEEIKFWASLYFASPYIRIIRAKEIEGEEELKKFFDIK